MFVLIVDNVCYTDISIKIDRITIYPKNNKYCMMYLIIMYNFLANFLIFFETYNISIRNEIINRILNIKLFSLFFVSYISILLKEKLASKNLIFTDSRIVK